MGDVLSQSQIDALLNSFSSGGSNALNEEVSAEAEKKVKSYDFKTPKKFTKEQTKIISDIYQIYSRLLSSYLTGTTRLYCKVQVLSIEEQRYFEFNNALPDHVMLGIVDLGVEDEDIIDTTCIMQVSNAITFTLIDRLLGGYGPYAEFERDFTEIEIGLLQRILVRMADILKESWSGYMDISPQIVNIETNSRASQSVPPDEVIVLVTLGIEMANVKNVITICLPAVTMENAMAKFSDQYSLGIKRQDAARVKKRRDEIFRNIQNSPLKIDVVLSETQIDLFDILTLQPDDVIPLNVPITHNATVKINNNLWFDGKLGVSNNKKAIKIDNIYKE
ncbi:MAG: flagellar motor switch protein FliM [Oscillospiraceae bacterium]|jgi:flagellar motor switch protein FliM|nr:flagellar motor switch protein FliM [Oscillospiraceae bacterium]